MAIQADTNDPSDNKSRIGPNRICKAGASRACNRKVN